MLVEPILADHDFGGAPAIVMLNGMGATPLIELYLLFGEVNTRWLERPESGSRAAWSATTSPPWTWPAASVTVLRADVELLGLWDAPVSTPALRWGV